MGDAESFLLIFNLPGYIFNNSEKQIKLSGIVFYKRV